MRSIVLVIWLLILPAGYGQVRPLSFGAETFLEEFNRDNGRARLVGVFSPTCAHCLQTCADVQDILERHPEAKIDVFFLWAPLQVGDNIGEATKAAAYLPDPRVAHFWDIWKFTSRAYSPQFRILVEDAWGLLVLYPPGTRWEGEPPAPEFWMQSRQLRVGTPYSKRSFERRLQRWLR
jgi:hypothetical protein